MTLKNTELKGSAGNMKEPSSPKVARWLVVFSEIRRALLVLVCLMLLMVLLLAAVGEFSFDASGHHGLRPIGGRGPEFGLIDSPMRGLEAYFNPALELIAFTQFFALLVLPFALFVFRKRLHLAVVPWVLVALFVAACAWLGLFTPSSDGMYPLLGSRLPWLLKVEAITIFGVGISYSSYVAYKLRHELEHRKYLSKKNVLIAIIMLVGILLGTALLYYVSRPEQVCETYRLKGQVFTDCRYTRSRFL